MNKVIQIVFVSDPHKQWFSFADLYLVDWLWELPAIQYACKACRGGNTPLCPSMERLSSKHAVSKLLGSGTFHLFGTLGTNMCRVPVLCSFSAATSSYLSVVVWIFSFSLTFMMRVTAAIKASNNLSLYTTSGEQISEKAVLFSFILLIKRVILWLSFPKGL